MSRDLHGYCRQLRWLNWRIEDRSSQHCRADHGHQRARSPWCWTNSNLRADCLGLSLNSNWMSNLASLPPELTCHLVFRSSMGQTKTKAIFKLRSALGMHIFFMPSVRHEIQWGSVELAEYALGKQVSGAFLGLRMHHCKCLTLGY